MGKAERTKEHIIEKIAGVFNEKGFAGTSMHDITELTGLTKGSIYGNFKNKDDVAIAVFNHNIEKLRQIFTAEIEKKSSCREKLLVYPNLYQNYFKVPFPEGGCPIMNTAIEADDTHPELKQLAQNALLEWKKGIEAILKKGISNNEFSKDIDVKETAYSILALIEGGVMMAKLNDNLKPLNAAMNTLKKMINTL